MGVTDWITLFIAAICFAAGRFIYWLPGETRD